MRRIFAEEEKAAPSRQTSIGPQHDEERHQSGQRTAPQRRKPSGASRVGRWALLALVSLGLFAALVPAVTGVPLNEWLQGANFKSAYSLSNLAFSRGMAALKLGNLPAATDALTALTPLSPEAEELGSALFPLLLEKGDLERAALVRRYASGKGGPLLGLGVALVKKSGLAGAVAFCRSDASARQVGPPLLAEVFSAASEKELPALIALQQTLSGAERDAATQNIYQAYRNLREFPAAWSWTQKLPAEGRGVQQAALLQEWATFDVEATAALLEKLPASKDTAGILVSVVQQLGQVDLDGALRLAQKLPPGQAKQSIISNLKLRGDVNTNKLWEEQLLRLLKGLDPPQRADRLVSLAMEARALPSRLARVERLLAEQAARDPYTHRLHDDLLRYLMVENPIRSFREKCLARILDPATKKALTDEVAQGGPWRAELKWGGGSASTSRGVPPTPGN